MLVHTVLEECATCYSNYLNKGLKLHFSTTFDFLFFRRQTVSSNPMEFLAASPRPTAKCSSLSYVESPDIHPPQATFKLMNIFVQAGPFMQRASGSTLLQPPLILSVPLIMAIDHVTWTLKHRSWWPRMTQRLGRRLKRREGVFGILNISDMSLQKVFRFRRSRDSSGMQGGCFLFFEG